LKGKKRVHPLSRRRGSGKVTPLGKGHGKQRTGAKKKKRSRKRIKKKSKKEKITAWAETFQ